MGNLQDNLFKAIENINSQMIESTPIDLTITVEIINIKNVEVGQYLVKYKGDQFNAFSMDPMTVFRVGEEVYCLVPQGDFSAKKIILGRAAFNDKVSYADRQAMSNQWRTRGPNWLSTSWYWRTSQGQARSDERNAGIIACQEGQENNITNANWRDYIFQRTAGYVPPISEPNFTNARQNKTKYPIASNRMSLDSLQKIDKQFQVYANNYEHVMISADFNTEFSSVHSSGEYGILVEAYIDNPKYNKENYDAEPERLLTTLRFSFADFNGSPYTFTQKSPQRAVFPVPKGTLKGLVRVCLFQSDGWQTDIVPYYDKNPNNPQVLYTVPPASYVYNRNNIFASDIQIYWCEPINLSESLFWLKIDAPRGTSLYRGTGTISPNVSVPLEGHLFYGSEELTSRETCKFIWFRQKYSATMDKVNFGNPLDPEDNGDKDEYGRTWYDYSIIGDKPGWAPIERLMLSPQEDPIFGENTGLPNGYRFEDENWHQTLHVGIDIIPWQWKYKLVCIYNPAAANQEEQLARDRREVILFETEILVNEDSIYDFELPTQMLTNDLITTYLRVRNNTLPWIEGTHYNPQNPEKPDNSDLADPTKDWWCRWWMSTPSGLYQPVPPSGSPRFLKGMRSINDYLTYDAITFMAQIYGVRNATSIANSAQVIPPGWPQNLNQSIENNEYEIANVEITLLKSDEFFLLVDWEGITHHSYNSDGSIQLEDSVGAEFSLRAILHWADSSIMDYSIEWIAPDGETPLRHHSTYPGGEAIGTGFYMSDSMMYDMWVGADNIVRYKVQQKYDINKTKNTFILRVSLIDGKVFSYPIEITFSKAGQNGTQGSDWEARIWPTNETQIVNSGDGSIAFPTWTEEIRSYVRPLVVKGNFNGSGDLIRDDNYRLFLRPFVRKNGKRIEELADADDYSYKVYWDSRFPNVKNNTLGPRYNARQGSLFEFISADGRSVDVAGSGFSPGPTRPFNMLNTQAYTYWTNSIASNSFGAIEVKWRNNRTVGEPGVSIADIKYDFVIRAQVDIYKQSVLIATVFSYWPIDVIFTNNINVGMPSSFNKNKIKTNWPQFVTYNPTGYGPEVHQDHLRFFYGDKANNLVDPLPFTAAPINLTPTIQSIGLENSQEPKSWRFYPRPYYFYEDCANGSMCADFTLSNGDDWAPNNPNKPGMNPDFEDWGNCTYVRPVVYHISYFGNTDINGWDGKSIDINDERGTIFAPTIGAGWKDPFTNKFSGVIMGIDTSQRKDDWSTIGALFSNDDLTKNPYMTGLYGYQDGAASFGLMENGTAFFGRADRGGRIIIDGFNAQIYGGINGDMGGNRDMDMHNRMRLSFIDFEGLSNSPWNNLIGVSDEDNARNILTTDQNTINIGAFDVSDFNDFFAPRADSSTAAARYSGFGSGRGFGTPAIEIGSYRNYLYDASGNRYPNRTGSDLIREIKPRDALEWYNSINRLEIPGNRKFLVTYDGTLYSMNAFIKGNIVGSNIIGSQFFNDDGSFGVTEEGHMYAGQGGGPAFEEYFVENYGEWSAEPPSVGGPYDAGFILNTSDERYTALAPNDSALDVWEQINGSPFFVANDGRVFCQEIHVSGQSSINIGGFHVVPEPWGGHGGDVFSFGTMYIVGPGGGTWNSEPAVEAWGGFFLRGKLVNLGQVLIGGSYEKTLTSPSPMNSPLSITPTAGSGYGTTPVLPVRSGFWPLYLYCGSLNATLNDTWVCISTPTAVGGANNGYMPAFATRPPSMRTFMTNAEGGTAMLAQSVRWRIDKVGMWTDAIIFTNQDQTPMADTSAANFNTHGLLFMGLWDGNGTGAGGAKSFTIKNINNQFPTITIETLRYMHISAGKDVGRGRGGALAAFDTSYTIMDTWKPGYTGTGPQHLGATLCLSGAQDSATTPSSLIGTATTINLTGRSKDRSTVEAFLFINGIRSTTNIIDEQGRIIDRVPQYQVGTNSQARIWMKAVGIAIDGTDTIANVDTNNNISTVRVNRSWDGSESSGGMPVGYGDATGKNFIGIGSGTIMLSSRSQGAGASNTIHIKTDGDDNNPAVSELFLNGPMGRVHLYGAATLDVGAQNMVRIGTMTMAHSYIASGPRIEIDKETVSIYEYDADHQNGIYARFG